jgi:uncharacterized protein (TIGR02246 family)
MCFRLRAMSLMSVTLILLGALAHCSAAEDDAAIAAVNKSAENLLTAFNAGKIDELTAMFLPKGELIDEEGTVYQGPAEIKGLLTSFFEKFPGAKLARSVDSVRIVGPIAIEEGTRTITTKDGSVKSQFRYIAIWAKADRGWQLASIRDFADDPAPTPHERLEPVAFLVGDWINEGADGKVSISYRWSDDKNYLLGDFQFKDSDGTVRKSTQRIGWDPAAGKIRSWLFDADGGFAEAIWTVTDDEVVLKSSSVNPEGSTASATMTITTGEKGRFTIAGSDRVVGDSREPDFEITVVRRPPVAAK